MPTAMVSGPTVSGIRGPWRDANAPARLDSSSIKAVTGSSATPAWTGL